MIVFLRWPVDEARQYTDPKPDGKGGYWVGRTHIPAHAVAWEYELDPNQTPKERAAKTELHHLGILTALDGMGGKAPSKEQLFKAVGGNRTKFFAALQVLIDSGQVRSDGRRIIVSET